MFRPFLQQFGIRRFHNLEAARAAGLNPTRAVDDAFREHPAALPEALADKRRLSGLKTFNDHEEHTPQLIPPWTRVEAPREALDVSRTASLSIGRADPMAA